MPNKFNIKRWRPKQTVPSGAPPQAAQAAPSEPQSLLPVFDPRDPEQGWLWQIHLRRVQRYGPAAALFSGIKQYKDGQR